jgi:hypothetical protein
MGNRSVLQMKDLRRVLGLFLVGTVLQSCIAEDGGDVWIVNADVHGNDRNDVYVGGYKSGCGCELRGFVRHYDGESWTTIYQSKDFDIWSIWSAADQVFATNDRGVLRYRNDGWEQLPFEGESGSVLALFDISGTSVDNVIAVGRGGTILSFDGDSLKTVPSDTSAELHGVWLDSPTAGFAVGESGMVLRYEGQGWSRMDSGTDRELNAIWGSSADNVYAVGGSETEGGYIILHFDGNAWTTMEEGIPYHLLGISGISATDIYAVGAYRGGDNVTGVVLHHDGTGWKRVETDIDQFIWSVWAASEGDYFLAGPGDTLVHERP